MVFVIDIIAFLRLEQVLRSNIDHKKIDGHFRKHFPMRTNSCSLYEQVMSITVTPTTSAVGIKAGFGPGASNTNSWVPIGIGPVESSSSSKRDSYKSFEKLHQMGLVNRLNIYLDRVDSN